MDAIRIGFTGTREGMTPFQRDQLEFALAVMQKGISYLHHGGCIGADEQAHRLAQKLGFRCCIHPPDNNSKYVRELEESAWEVHQPFPYLTRNQDIVDNAQILIATPKEPSEVLRSGTWATVRRAKDNHVPVLILAP